MYVVDRLVQYTGGATEVLEHARIHADTQGEGREDSLVQTQNFNGYWYW